MSEASLPSEPDPAADEFEFPSAPDPTPKRPSTALDQYRRATDAMRDTTKWVVSFVPGAAVVVTLATVIPAVAQMPASERTAAAVLLVIAGLAVVAAVAAAGAVLAASQPTWSWIVDQYGDERSTDKRSLPAELDREGVLRIYGYDDGSQLFTAISDRQLRFTETVTEPVATVLDFAALRKVRGRFVIFAVVGVLCGAVAVGCVTGAQTLAASAIRAPDVTAATPVRIVVSERGAQQLMAAGCEEVAEGTQLPGILVAGSVDGGTVIAIGDRCGPVAVEWSAERDGLLIPASSATLPNADSHSPG